MTASYSDAKDTAARSAESIETTRDFTPRFDEHGLLPAIVTDAAGGNVLMFAFMNADALHLSVTSGYAHFYSRSRRRLWKKGEESGNLLKIVEMRTDCDQDVVWLRVKVEGDGVACHTGAPSCFYRRIDASTAGAALKLSGGPGQP